MNLGTPRYGYFLLAILLALFGYGFSSAGNRLFSPDLFSGFDGICVAFALVASCIFSYAFAGSFILCAIFGKDHEL